MAATSEMILETTERKDHWMLALWKKWKDRPMGPALFSWGVGRKIPYTGSVKPRVVEMSPGKSLVEFRDRRAVRNHLRSIHACAMVTAGEFAAGIALHAGLPADGRAILTNISVEYVKKGRGTLMIEGRSPVVFEQLAGAPLEKQKVDATSTLKDSSGDVVSRVTTTWLVGPSKKK